MTEENAKALRHEAEQLQRELSDYRKQVIGSIQKKSVNIESSIVYLNIVQESEQILSCIRHMLRGISKFTAGA